MTIIEPNKNKKTVAKLLWGGGALLFGIAIWSVMVYNETVNIEQAIKIKDTELHETKAKNIELQNTLYALTDVRRLREAADRAGLMRVEKPEYIEIGEGIAIARAER